VLHQAVDQHIRGRPLPGVITDEDWDYHALQIGYASFADFSVPSDPGSPVAWVDGLHE
jgi:hypothetical protein